MEKESAWFFFRLIDGMKGNLDQKHRLYGEIWRPIDANVDRVSYFMRDYLAWDYNDKPEAREVGKKFGGFVDEKCIINDKINEEKIEELLRFSGYYRAILYGQAGHESASIALKWIDKLYVRSTYTYLMDVFEARHKGWIDSDAMAKIITSVESFVFRWFVCHGSTGDSLDRLDKILVGLKGEIRKQDYQTRYLEIFKDIISGKVKEKNLEDKDFREVIEFHNIEKNIGWRSKYLLCKLENDAKKGSLNLDADGWKIKGEKMNVDHIMPKNLNKWKKGFGDEEVKKLEETNLKYLSNLGNLTLLSDSDNKSVGNEPFEKRKGYYKESSLWVNKYVAKQNKWGEKEIKERAKFLANHAVKLWPRP